MYIIYKIYRYDSFDCHGNKAKFTETTTWNETRSNTNTNSLTLACVTLSMCKTGHGPQILAMAVCCFAPSVNVIPNSGSVSAFLYWARNTQALRAHSATGFHPHHVRWINTCNALLQSVKRASLQIHNL